MSNYIFDVAIARLLRLTSDPDADPVALRAAGDQLAASAQGVPADLCCAAAAEVAELAIAACTADDTTPDRVEASLELDGGLRVLAGVLEARRRS